MYTYVYLRIRMYTYVYLRISITLTNFQELDWEEKIKRLGIILNNQKF